MSTIPSIQTAEDALQRYVQSRDPEAFEQLVLRYQAMVYAACRRHLDVAADVEDAVQETFLKLARKAQTIRSNLSAWLYTTALHTASNVQRRSQTRQKYERSHAVATRHSDEKPDEPTWQQLGPEIDRALETLVEADRQLLTERFLLGRSATELAEELNVSRVTLHKRQNRAIERLRAALTKRGVVLPAAALLVTLSSAPAEAAPPVALTASLMKIGMAGVGSSASGTAAVGVSASVATAGGATLGFKGLITAGATLLFGTALVGLLAAQDSADDSSRGQNATSAAATKQTPQLPDPAVAGTWAITDMNNTYDLITFSGDTIDLFFIEREQARRVGHPINTRITAINPDAKPATLDTLEDGEQPQHGRAIYRFRGDELELYMAFGMNSQPPQRPKSFDKDAGNYLHAMLRKQPTPIQHPEYGRKRKPVADPRLTGDWIAYGGITTEFTPGGKSLVQRFRFTGEMLSELKILTWDTNKNPRRIEGILVYHQQKRLIGRMVKLIYRVNGDRLTIAHHDLNTEASLTWPNSFKKADGLDLVGWERLPPADN